MALDLIQSTYNPDVLSCLANLSNDEVFTPPEVVNQMLDMLPQELFSNPDTTFLDPATKSGVFLREIAKRLMNGLEKQIPDLQARVDHIFKKQLFGIAMTELTSLLARRSLYCSKYPNSSFSVTKFESPEGNIRYRRTQHSWVGGKCIYCGASQSELDRGDELETHAYEWIHTNTPERIFNMKFDVICSNPPYQLETNSTSKQAKPIYNLFVDSAKRLNPRFITMIIPSRWFAGGMGLDDFRESMLKDNRLSTIVDYANAKDCFSGVSVSGGACYFLWSRDYNGACKVVNINDGNRVEMTRPLNEFPILVRYNRAVDVVRSVINSGDKSISDVVSSISPFGIPTNIRGRANPSSIDKYTLHASSGTTFISSADIVKGHEWIGKYKVMVSQTSSEHAGEPSKDGTFKVLTSSVKPLGPDDVCTHSYILMGPYQNANEAINCANYLKTKFVRFLILQALTSIHLTRNTFIFVPNQDFSRAWSDEDLYKKYAISAEDIDFIESMIKSYDGGDD